jgi:hypothetical protein
MLRRGKLFDSELNAECSYRAAADGSWRCLPTLDPDGLQTFGFSDSSCTKRVTWFDPAQGGCTPDRPDFVYALDGPPYCGYQSGLEHHAHVFPLGSAIAQPIPLYAKSGADCVAISAPLGKAYYSVDAELPPADFVAGTRQVAP